MKDKVLQEMKRVFRPEFLNRVDATLVFHTLSKAHIRQVVDIMLRQVEKQVVLKGHNLDVTSAARDWLGEKGYDPVFGARPLRRVIQERLEDSLSEALLRGEFEPGDTIRVDLGSEKDEDGKEEEKLVYERVAASPVELDDSTDDQSEGDSPTEAPAVATN